MKNKKPVLIIISGVPSSGKTTLSKAILKKIKGVYLDKDMINDGFTDLRHGEFYDIVRTGTYRAVDIITKENLLLGNTVLIDATFSKEVGSKSWMARYKKMAKDTSSKLKFIRCVLGEDMLFKRMKKRGFLKDRSKLDDFKAFLKKEQIKIKVKGQLEVDSANDFKENLRIVLDFIEK